MKSTDLIQPSYVEGIPECSETCPSHDGKRCKVQGCRPGLLCRPAVAEMAARVTELERVITRILAEEDPEGRRVRYDEARETLAGQKEEKV